MMDDTAKCDLIRIDTIPIGLHTWTTGVSFILSSSFWTEILLSQSLFSAIILNISIFLVLQEEPVKFYVQLSTIFAI